VSHAHRSLCVSRSYLSRTRWPADMVSVVSMVNHDHRSAIDDSIWRRKLPNIFGSCVLTCIVYGTLCIVYGTWNVSYVIHMYRIRHIQCIVYDTCYVPHAIQDISRMRSLICSACGTLHVTHAKPPCTACVTYYVPYTVHVMFRILLICMHLRCTAYGALYDV